MAYYSRTRIERVSEALSELRYSEMQDLARSLCDMISDRGDDFDAIDKSAMADLLSDWAQDTEEAVAEAAAGAVK